MGLNYFFYLAPAKVNLNNPGIKGLNLFWLCIVKIKYYTGKYNLAVSNSSLSSDILY